MLEPRRDGGAVRPDRGVVVHSEAWHPDASAVFRRRYGGLRGLRAPDVAILSRLLGGESEQHGELISYLLFDSEFHEQAIALGRLDAERWLKRVSGPDAPWYAEPIDALPDS